MKELFQALLTVEEVVRKHNGIHGLLFNILNDRIEVQIASDYFIEFAEAQDISPSDIDVLDWPSENFHKQLVIETQELMFTSLIEKNDYEKVFSPWLSDNPANGVFVNTPRGVTVEQIRMKEAGMNLYKDFI